MNFTLRSQTINFGDDFIQLNNLRNEFREIALCTKKDFKEAYISKFTNMKQLSEQGEAFGIGFLIPALNTAVEILIRYGVYSVDLDTFIEKYYIPYCTWFERFDQLNEIYISINRNQQQMEEYRNLRKASRGKWQGGGFGFSGAVKGAMQAGAMNMATGLAHSIVNTTGNMASSISASYEKSQLFNSPETLNNLADAIATSVFSVHIAIIDALRENGVYDIANYSSEAQVAKSIALLNNIVNGLIPENKEDEVFKEIIQNNPYNVEIYQTLLIKYADPLGEVDTLSEFLFSGKQIDFKLALLDEYFKNLSLDTEEKTKESKIKLIDYASNLRIDSYQPYLEVIENALIEHDRKIRTVDFIEFTTREEAAIARQELLIINNEVFEIINETEEEINAAITNIKNAKLTTCLAEKYLERLELRLEKAIRHADQLFLNENFNALLLANEDEINLTISKLKDSDVRTLDLVHLKIEELENRKVEIIKEKDVAFVERILRKYLFFKQEHIDTAINEISQLNIRTQTVKEDYINHLTSNSENIIRDNLFKLEKAKRYEQRQNEPKEKEVKKGFKGFISKITTSLDALMGIEEEEKEAWEYITNNGMRTLQELDVD